MLAKDTSYFSLYHSEERLSRFLLDIGSLASILFLLFRIHLGMACIVIAIIPLVFLILHFVGKRLLQATEIKKRRQDKLAALFQEVLRGLACRTNM